MPYDLVDKIDPFYDYENYVKQTKFRLQTSHTIARSLLNKMKHRNKN